ncbi:MAG: PQQ-binding-like beta-propeller repeat protein, partial [Zavarzinella sp.]|nr:PQQ-binding-like beta-propeller repeat protein [Zavarzinella sp.]
MFRALLLTLAVAAPVLAGPKVDQHGDPLPEGAAVRFGTVRDYIGAPNDYYSPGPRRSFALSADGKTLAAEVAGGVNFWDVDAGTVARRLPARPAQGDHPCFGLAFSPDGKRLARMAGRFLTVWDLATGKELFAIDYKRERRFETIAFAGDDHIRVTGLELPRIWTIDARTGKIVRTVELPNDYTALIPAGPLLVGCGPHSDWTLIDPETGRAKCRFRGVISAIETITPSPDGRRVWVLGTGGLFRAIDTETGKELLEDRDGPSDPWGRWFAPLAVSPDGAVVFAGIGRRTVQRWGAKDGKWLPPIRDVAPGELLPHPDGKRLLVLGTDGVLRRYDLTTLKPLPGADGFAGRVAAYPSPDGGRVLIASGQDGSDGRLDLFEVGGRCVWSVRPGDAGGVPHWTLDGHRLACVGGQAITLRDAATGQAARVLRAPGPDQAFAGLAYFPPERDRLIAPLDGGVALAVFDLRGEAPAAVVRTNARGATDLSPDGRRMAYAAKEDGVRLFEPATGRFTTRWPNPGNASEPAAGRPRFSPAGHYLLSWETKWVGAPTYGSRTHPVLRDAVSLDLRRELEPQPPAEVAFSPDGLYVAIVRAGAKWSLWDVPTGGWLGTWEGHQDEITSIG